MAGIEPEVAVIAAVFRVRIAAHNEDLVDDKGRPTDGVPDEEGRHNLDHARCDVNLLHLRRSSG